MRREDWWERLMAVKENHERLPLEWGISDCFVLVMDAIQAQTGNDPYLDARDYSSEAEAGRHLAQRGFKDVGEALAAVLEEIPQAMAQRGDVGVIKSEYGVSGVIFLGRDVVGKDRGGGLLRVPRSLVFRAFRVE